MLKLFEPFELIATVLLCLTQVTTAPCHFEKPSNAPHKCCKNSIPSNTSFPTHNAYIFGSKQSHPKVKLFDQYLLYFIERNPCSYFYILPNGANRLKIVISFTAPKAIGSIALCPP